MVHFMSILYRPISYKLHTAHVLEMLKKIWLIYFSGWIKSLQAWFSFSRKCTRRWREWETLIPSRNGSQTATFISKEKKINKFWFHLPHAIGVDRLNGETATSPTCIVPARVPQTILRFFLVFFFLNSTSYANCMCPKWNDCWLPVCCVCRLDHSPEIAIQQIGRPRGTGNCSLIKASIIHNRCRVNLRSE
jgi:hypothetical protein